METNAGRKENLVVAAIFFVGVAATSALLGYFSRLPALFEPDRLYHFALLREAVSQHAIVLREWPQFPLLGWNEFFADKEFLFHFILRIPFQIFGENGAIYSTAVFSSVLVWLPFLFFRRNRTFALAISFVALICHHYLLYRLCLLRPHTLSVMLFSLMLLLLLKGCFRAAAVAALLFNLAYHAFYLVVLVGVVALAWGIFCPSPRMREEINFKAGALWVFAGCLAGLILNPYFPANISVALQTFALGLRVNELQSSLHLSFGGELVPRTIYSLVYEWAGVLSAMVVAAYYSAQRKFSQEFFFLGILAVLFLVGSAKNPRTLEYAIPICALFLAATLRHERTTVKVGLLVFILLCQAPALYRFVHAANTSAYNESPMPGEIAALLAPVKSKSPIRIYHDNWSLGPYIAYLNPLAQAVDALDPTLLLMANPKLTVLRTELNAGSFKKPAEIIRKEFGAKFALCDPTPLQWQLLHSSGAKKIAETKDHRFILFEIL